MAKKILIVDDASLIRNITQRAVEEAGFEAVVASNGQEGLQALEKNEIDFIFSDINMPIMSGMEMIEELRNIPQYKYTPIVMLTTETKKELQAQAKELGVKAWLVKPFNKDKFLLVLQKLLG
ncbi:response regulator [Sulfurimonas sp. SAG-AH-194-C21]|nr:response regulator [Sulfurimonas sp. SAG-AH-194-C21]MDF1884062.1 response regulator [Sulfurimonas sp. SAG-AH-194-C21]